VLACWARLPKPIVFCVAKFPKPADCGAAAAPKPPLAAGDDDPNTFSGLPKEGAAPKAGDPPKLGADPNAGELPKAGGLPKPDGFWKAAGDPNPVCATGEALPPLKAPDWELPKVLEPNAGG